MTPELRTSQEYRPLLLPRTTEVIVWLLCPVLLGSWWVLRINQASFAGTTITLFAFMLFMASGISLSSWMDRRSVIRLDAASISFQNGLRDVTLTWRQVEKVRVLSAQANSKRVQVLGERSHFEFRTLAVLFLKGKERGRSGFAEGEQILETILRNAGLHAQESSSMYQYYGRE